MVRGIVPRQPSKRGRQEGATKAPRRAEVRGVSREKKPNRQADVRPGGGGPQKHAHAGVAKAAKPKTGYDPLAPQRVNDLLKRLDAAYPAATCALQHRNAWELLVATILSAQCTDERVNKVTPALFQKYPRPQAFAALQPQELEPDIQSTGFFRNKSKSIVGAARKVVAEFGGQVPDEMEPLLTLPGVARKTANVVLGTWFGKAEGVVVDTHVHRIARRLELTENDDPKKIEEDLMRVIPRDRWIGFAHQLIWHGRKLCTARQPKCADCPLENLCHAADKTWSTVEVHATAHP
jgi:endonuclease-3